MDLLISTIASLAFAPDPGSMGYDAGQVFGGFAYSEDDLLSRSYRDSALFRFLAPGHGASARLHASLGPRCIGRALPELGDLGAIRGEPLGGLASRLSSAVNTCAKFPSHTDPACAGNA